MSRQDEPRASVDAFNLGFEAAADIDVKRCSPDGYIRIDQQDYPMVAYDDEQVRTLIDRLEEVLDDE